MIPNTIIVDGVEYYFNANGGYNAYNGIMNFYYDSFSINNRGKSKIFEVIGETFKEAESKMVEALKNSGITK